MEQYLETMDTTAKYSFGMMGKVTGKRTEHSGKGWLAIPGGNLSKEKVSSGYG